MYSKVWNLKVCNYISAYTPSGGSVKQMDACTLNTNLHYKQLAQHFIIEVGIQSDVEEFIEDGWPVANTFLGCLSCISVTKECYQIDFLEIMN